jgi:tRNA (guanine37-N1)-methyltransferase
LNQYAVQPINELKVGQKRSNRGISELVRLREALAKSIPADKSRLMYDSYDIIGDIAVIKMPYELDQYEEEVGKAFHEARPSLKSVFRVIGDTERIERTRELRLIWNKHTSRGRDEPGGRDISRTVYREHGCRFVVDVRNVFFTPRLSHERMRIAKQVKAGEVVACMFGGVCTYAVIIAKVCPNVDRVYSVDINPAAYELGKENVIINKCFDKVIPILGDARTVCRDQLKGICSRVIMPLPEQAVLFLDSAVEALREGVECIINFYAEVSGTQFKNEAVRVMDEINHKLLDYGVRRSEAAGWRIVRQVGRRRYHTAIDMNILK